VAGRAAGKFGLRVGVLLAGLAGLAQPAAASDRPVSASSEASGPTEAAYVRKHASWAVSSGDSAGLPFLVIDKLRARVFAFAPDGAARGEAAILLGLTRGDISPEGIGKRRLADIKPSDRITPAGRFEAWRGRNIVGKDILWLDYEEALSLHSVVTGTSAEQRLKRLASPSALDNRISYGCINVPAKFYDEVVRPLFGEGAGIVYILPEAPSAPLSASLGSAEGLTK
jgi:hypothetical protein